MEPIRFEDGLAALFQRGADLVLLALAESAGLSHRVPDWLRSGAAGDSRKKVGFEWFGHRSIDEVASFWRVLREGNASDIRQAAQALLAAGQVPTTDTTTPWLAFDSLVTPLTLLGRGDAVVALHDELLETNVSSITERAAVALAKFGDWDGVLTILERGHRDGRYMHFNLGNQILLWKLAYLHRQVETVLPRLAKIPLENEAAHVVEERSWRLMTYRIRAGMVGTRVPVIEHDDQSLGYVEAAATQIAALEGDPSAGGFVAELRRVLKPKSVTMEFPDRGFSLVLTDLPRELLTAEARIAARRKDYAKAEALARSGADDPYSLAADIVIDAFLEEGDWRAAAAIADQHDPRDRPVLPGFDDARSMECLFLQEALATAAARGGDDAAVAAHFANYVEVISSDLKEERDDIDWDRARLWRATLLAGAAEGVLPRKFLAVLLPIFRNPY